MTSDLHATFGHRPIYIRGEAATFIPHSRKACIHNQWTESPRGLALNPEPILSIRNISPS